MKICPKCQQQYPNGFQYCPNDTEILVAEKETVRHTKPIISRPVPEAGDGPNVEVVPIAKPVPEEPPTAPWTPPANRTPSRQEPDLGGRPAPQSPPRRVEVIQNRPETPRPQQAGQQQYGQPAAVPPRGEGGNLPPQAPRSTQSGRQPERTERIERAQVAATPPLSFSLPDQGGLFARLGASFKNFKYVFSRAPGGTRTRAVGDFQFLLPEEPLTTRIGREISGAISEFRRNPRQFMIGFVRGEGSNRQRRNTLLAGSEMAFVGYVTVYFISLALSSAEKVRGTWAVKGFFIGFAIYLAACYVARGLLLYRLINSVSNKIAAPKIALEVFNWGPIVGIFLAAVFLSNYNFYCKIFPDRCVMPEEQLEKLALLTPPPDMSKVEIKAEESPKAKEKTIGGSKPKPKPASGGGGGGRQTPTPPSQGVPPQMALTPQIIPPNPEPPKIKNPTLVVASTVYGDPKALPPMKGPIGDPTGIPAPPSPGPGTGAGIGRGAGTGVGGGEGGGVGPGRGGNTGGGNMGLGGGGTIEPMSANLRPQILYKEKAKYTEEARQNKVQGTVVLNVVFTADGRISSIRVVRGLPDGLTEKAIEAAQKIRFTPAVKGGTPVSVRGNLEFTFNLY
jgi:periplasmic protein TonB